MIETPTTAATPTIAVSNDQPLFDEPIEILISGCPPTTTVAMTTTMPLADGTYQSVLTYNTDETGCVNLATTAPTEPFVPEPSPMAPFWAMQRIDETPNADHTETVHTVEASLSVAIAGQACCTKTIERTIVTDDVSRTPLQGDCIGDLWLSTEAEAAPGVIVLGGSEGGYPPQLPVGLLASRGYAVAAPAYFGVEGLPETLEEIDIRTLDPVLDALQTHPKVRDTNIAIIGWSRGAELALTSAARDPRLSTAISWAGSPLRFDGVPDGFRSPQPAWTDRTGPMDALALNPSPSFLIRAGRSLLTRSPFSLHQLYLRALTTASKETQDAALIDLDQIAGTTLLFSGGDDRLWPSTRLCEFASERFDADVVHQSYPRAGHALGVPYRPLGGSTVGPPMIPGVQLALGGEPYANATASANAWVTMLSVLASVSSKQSC